jgi:predicted PurR-regulated permease PerM
MAQTQTINKIEISPKTILLIFGFYFLFQILYLVKDIILGLFVAVILSTALNPLVSKLEKLRIPRAISVLIIYLLLIVFVVFSISTIVPPLVQQTTNLIKSFPSDIITQNIHLEQLNFQAIELLSSQLTNVLSVIKVISSTFSIIVAIVTFLVITFYLLIERKHLHRYIKIFFNSKEAEKEAEAFVNKFELQIGGWVRGEFILMMTIGVMTYIGLSLLRIEYALPLALAAGILEAVPNIGPTLSAIPAILVAYGTTMNPVTTLFVVALYILVQQLENHIIVPKVMQSSVGVNPLVTILTILVGLKLGGIIGGVLAVPIFLVLKLVYQDLIKPRNQLQT